MSEEIEGINKRFCEANLQKFRKGSIEHQDWDLLTPKELIDEMQGELIDLWNYVDKLKRKML